MLKIPSSSTVSLSLTHIVRLLITQRKTAVSAYLIQKEQWLQGEDSNRYSLIILFVTKWDTLYRGKKAGNDSRFFSSSKKGENHELREELRSPQRDRKRDAVKKVSAEVLSLWGH